ncbi:Fic family protein [Candidatus Woesearchaeota archaeon]|nr:Fic family protein [Candidatus Woesearchaeota archaeon]
MVYIYKKIIHGKSYYYLRISRKIKEKFVIKDIAYLGNDISGLQKKLENLSDYKKEIRGSYRKIKNFIESEHYLIKIKEKKLKEDPYLEKNLLEEIEAIKLHYTIDFLRLDEKTKQDIYKAFLIDFAFNTTSIEGNTITLKEAERLLNENLTPKNRTLREIYDLQNTEKVFFEILNTKKDLDHEFIVFIHDSLLDNVDVRKGYRTRDIRVFKSRFDASPGQYVKVDMDLLLKWYKENKKKFHPFVLAGIFHHKFEKIHPFFDGNGRTGRMLMIYILLTNNFPPLFIRKSRRGKYLDAMANADSSNLKESSPENYEGIISYLAEEMINSYWNNFLV